MDIAALIESGRGQQALPALEAHLRLKPKDWQALRLRGIAQIQVGQLQEARQSLNKALKLSKRNPLTLLNLASLERQLGKPDRARALFREAVRRKPDLAPAHFNLGKLERAEGHFESARQCFDEAVRLSPDRGDYWLWAGHVHRALGSIDKAAHCYRQSAAHPQVPGSAMWGLAGLRVVDLEDTDRDLMIDATENEQLPPNERSQAAFAHAHYLDRQGGQVEQAFEMFCRANRLAERPTGQGAWAEQAAAQIRAYFRDVQPADSQNEKPGPLFIVSMPRSGSTLVESMLAAGGQFVAGGELNAWDRILSERGALSSSNISQWLDSVGSQGVEQLGSEYCQSIAGNLAITDKSLGNGWWVGLIANALPSARFVLVERESISNIMGCFAQYFANGHHYSFSLDELVQWHAAHAELMQFWELWGKGRVVRTSLEAVVNQPEREIQRVCSSIGVKYTTAMVNSYTERARAATASAGQVRSELKPAWVNRWERYKPLISELKKASGNLPN
ncbi:MAG: sulfotransferase [Lysobacteraceae bacterium]|nr:MAG: sulfotransferase [Xanthomonadaceae bacterium]